MAVRREKRCDARVSGRRANFDMMPRK